MRVTIFGATGLLGKALMREWTGDNVSGLGSRDSDIRDPKQISGVLERTQPDCIVLAAAYADVDGCETNPEHAFEVNCRGALNVAQAAQQSDSRLLFLSTDYVFDGAKNCPYETNDPRAPLNVYGRSKAEAEVQISQMLPQCCILRTSWLFGIDGKCFPDTILKLAASRATIDVVDDQRGSPTYTTDLARTIIQLCRSALKELCTQPTVGIVRGLSLPVRLLPALDQTPWCVLLRVNISCGPPNGQSIPCSPVRVCRNMELKCRTGKMLCEDTYWREIQHRRGTKACTSPENRLIP